MKKNTPITVGPDKENTLSEKADMYMQIFGEEPWKEGFQCKECKSLYSLSEVKQKEIANCLCGSELQPFYNKGEVMNDRKNRAQKEGYIGKLAQSLEGELIGFILGWKGTLNEINLNKLKLQPGQYDQLIQSIQTTFPDFNDQRLFYAADMGVKNDRRNQGIASKLYDARNRDIQQNGFGYVLVRTTKTSDVPYKRYQQKGFVDIFDYNDQQDRVVMMKKV